MKFLIQHGEKIVAGVFGMITCYALATASWAPTTEIPNSLISTANENRDRISQNLWPDEEQTHFSEIRDVLAITSQGGEIVNSEDFDIIKFDRDQKAAIEKRKAVSVVAPESPRATVVVFPLAMPPEEDDTDETDTDTDDENKEAEGKNKEETDSDKEAAKEMLARKYGRRPENAGGRRGGAAGRLGGGLMGRGREENRRQNDDRNIANLTAALQAGGGLMGRGREERNQKGRDMVQQYGAGLMTEKKSVRVVAAVSVTMVLDLREQRRLIREALHLEGGFQVAQNEILYVDLVVERRQSRGDDQTWEPVSREDLAEILKESLGTDLDVVSPAVTRNSITMPLPRRAAGVWHADEASHPRVEEFELSEEERDIFDKANEILAKEFEEEEESRPTQVEVRGFAAFAKGATDFAESGNSRRRSRGDEDEGRRGRLSSRIEESFGDSGQKLTDKQRHLIDTSMATADHRLLLIRFLDATVERGRSYEYRCRVAMKNPNFFYPMDALEDPSLADDSEILSDWSKPTPSVLVPHGQRTYVAKVSARPGNREKVDLEIYTDTTKTGLPVMGKVKVSAGMPIGGKDSLEVVDLTTDVLELQEAYISTDETLIAAEELGRQFSMSDPDLKAMVDKLGRTLQPVPDQVTITNSAGKIALRWRGDMQAQKRTDEAEYKGVLEAYDSWKEGSAASVGEFFAGEEDGDDRRGGGRRAGMSRAASGGDFYQGQRGSRRGRETDGRRGRDGGRRGR